MPAAGAAEVPMAAAEAVAAPTAAAGAAEAPVAAAGAAQVPMAAAGASATERTAEVEEPSGIYFKSVAKEAAPEEPAAEVAKVELAEERVAEEEPAPKQAAPAEFAAACGLPALASIQCSGDAYAVLSLMADLGLQASGPKFEMGPYEVAVRRLAREFEQLEGPLLSQRRRRTPKKKH